MKGLKIALYIIAAIVVLLFIIGLMAPNTFESTPFTDGREIAMWEKYSQEIMSISGDRIETN